MESLTLLGFGAVCPDPPLRAELAFPCGDIERSAVPAPLRRRASQATQLAFSAADAACRHAGRSPLDLPTVFASVGGEIQVTDVLCVELAKPAGMVSPTAFHNAVHNTAAGYWSIAHGVTASATAMAAGHETFAMALLEAWCLLDACGGELLLAAYDERWPDYLAAPLGKGIFAVAMVLAAGKVDGGLAHLGRPHPRRGPPPISPWDEHIAQVPAMAAIPLLAAAHGGMETADIALSSNWCIPFQPAVTNR